MLRRSFPAIADMQRSAARTTSVRPCSTRAMHRRLMLTALPLDHSSRTGPWPLFLGPARRSGSSIAPQHLQGDRERVSRLQASDARVSWSAAQSFFRASLRRPDRRHSFLCSDLTSWAEQGVLLLNTSLTVRDSDVRRRPEKAPKSEPLIPLLCFLGRIALKGRMGALHAIDHLAPRQRRFVRRQGQGLLLLGQACREDARLGARRQRGCPLSPSCIASGSDLDALLATPVCRSGTLSSARLTRRRSAPRAASLAPATSARVRPLRC